MKSFKKQWALQEDTIHNVIRKMSILDPSSDSGSSPKMASECSSKGTAETTICRQWFG